MDLQYLFNGLDLDDYLILNDPVHPVSARKIHRLVNDRKFNLPLKDQSSLGQLITNTLFVSRFEQTWTESSMHLNGTSDHDLSYLVFSH